MVTDRVDIGPGESRFLDIPKSLIDDAIRQGKKTAKLRVNYQDEAGNDYEQVCEIDLRTMDIKEIKEKK